MNKSIQDLKNEISTSSTYDFLRNDAFLKDNTLFLTLGGSYAYGTNVETSDIDLRGVVAPKFDEVLGFLNKKTPFEQFIDDQTDTVLYEFNKFIKLITSANPNTIELLGTEPSMILYMSDEMQLIKDNIHLFLSQVAKFSFIGYASQQLDRLQNALARDVYPKDLKEEHICNSINRAKIHLKTAYPAFEDDQLLIETKEIDGQKQLILSSSIKEYPLRAFIDICSEMRNIVRNYDKLNHRNHKKDNNHLNKHAMHLIRLYLTGIDIFEKQQIITYRKDNLTLLKSIRNGDFQKEDGSYGDDFYDLLRSLEKRFNYAVANTSLQELPDYAAINELTYEINKRLFLKSIQKTTSI